jgi:hypothetical protein
MLLRLNFLLPPRSDVRAWAARAMAALALAAPVPATAASAAGDDTFADLQRPGPVIRITGNQGYKTFTLMAWQDGTRIDARGAHWSSFSWGREFRHPTVNETTRNNYPIQLGADWVGAYPVRKDLYNDGRCPPPRPEKLYFIGGVIEGTQPLSATWKESKAANGGGITLNALDSVIDGMRIHNIHDPFVPLEGNNFTIKNCWVSYSRDDAIENDGFAAGLVDDCLFDDTYCFYSARNTAGGAGRTTTPIDPRTGRHHGERGAQAEAPGGGAKGRVRIQNSLIALGNHPGANSVAGDTGRPNDRGTAMIAGFGHFWKQGDSRNPAVDLINNVFYIPRPFPGCKPNRYDVMPKPAGKIEGNIVIWMGDGEYPFKHPGFKVLSGKEGQAYWDKAKADWIARHPKVPRVKGDPGYDPKKHGAAEPPPAELVRIANGE